VLDRFSSSQALPKAGEKQAEEQWMVEDMLTLHDIAKPGFVTMERAEDTYLSHTWSQAPSRFCDGGVMNTGNRSRRFPASAHS